MQILRKWNSFCGKERLSQAYSSLENKSMGVLQSRHKNENVGYDSIELDLQMISALYEDSFEKLDDWFEVSHQ